MKKFTRIVIYISVLLYTIGSYGQSQGNDFQQQLQRLQTAVTQAKQTSTPAGATPAFNPNPTTDTTGITSPPITPPLNLPPQTNVTTTTTTTGPALPPGVPAPPGAGVINAPENEANNLRDQAFSETTDNLLPLTPDQIRTLHSLFSNTQRAVGETPGIPPRPTSSSKIVNLACGATPPIIRLTAGFVSSLVFLDASGAPWPIDSYDLGDPRSYNIQWDRKSNMLLVQAITEYKSGNLAVMLRGFGTPVMLTLLPGQRAVDYRVDLRIPSLGPNAAPSSMPEVLPGASNPILLDVLNGIPPVGSRALQIPGRDCSVWLLAGKIYLRTRLTVLSPAWISTLSSADGMHAYEMLPTPVILASENGKMVKLTIQGL
ncbi:MAG: type IV secretion protein IcmK [Gammaproteobacteria bacterium]|nr:type IV secretion protein IcmK [Gammaproteobacteria bacterium]